MVKAGMRYLGPTTKNADIALFKQKNDSPSNKPTSYIPKAI